MLRLAQFENIDPIYIGLQTMVYRGWQGADGKPVIIKALRNTHPSFRELVQFRNQFVISSNLDSPHIVKPIALERHDNGYLLIMPDQGAISLRQYLKQYLTVSIEGKQQLGEGEGDPAIAQHTPDHNLRFVLQVALQLTTALRYLSTERVVHKDIKPDNILIHPDTGHIQLIDFSIASLLPKEQQEPINPKGLEGTLAYIAPEQTGRMNRGIDYRTDFYALGVTLYELLTGRLPFTTTDPLELLHCHIAQDPIAPAALQTDGQQSPYPSMLSALIMKLMAKNAEERYQSAMGLQHDLEQCWQSLEKTGRIAAFELGKKDVCDRFLIPEKLYGREQEVQTLLTAFKRVCQGKGEIESESEIKNEMMLVAGFSGIGKTAVINEIHKPIVAKHGYFIRGKFDQFKRNIPFSAFVQAFRDLLKQLSSESDIAREQWQTEILAALGEEAQVIVELVPELVQIIGVQPPVEALSGTAAQNRFKVLLQKFIRVFTTAAHPLVIFLDDLQWADPASLQLIQVIMAESQGGYLLLLGAYRDNEVQAGHPLLITLSAIAKAGATMETLTLRPLSPDSVTQWVADTLRSPLTEAQSLADLVFHQTQGNPFFVRQALQVLHQEQCIVLDQEVGHWRFQQHQIQDAALRDDVLQFMAAQLLKLPTDTQTALKRAACLGAQFDVQTLAIVLGQTVTDVATALWPALRHGFIVPKDNLYKVYIGELSPPEQSSDRPLLYCFAHDRVQQAASSLMPEDERYAAHLQIGQLLEARWGTDLDNHVFELVNHFNQGVSLLDDPQQRLEVVNLNLLAASKARSATAYGAMVTYTQSGIELLPPNLWTSHYPLTFELHCLAIEANYAVGAFEAVETLLEITLAQTQTKFDTAKVNEWAIAGYIARQQFGAAFDCCVQTLKLLGIDFPLAAEGHVAQQLLTDTRQLMATQSITALADLPTMTDGRSLLAMRILSIMIAPTYQSNSHLLPILYALAVRLSIQQGNSLDAPTFYASYGGLLCATEPTPDDGCACGDLALALLEDCPDQSRRSRGYLLISVGASSWKSHVQRSIDITQLGIDSALAINDFENRTWNCFIQNQLCYFAGHNLTDLATKLQQDLAAITLAEQSVQREYIAIIYQTVLNLMTPKSTLGVLTGAALDEAAVLATYESQGIEQGLFCIYLHKAMLYFLADDIEQAFPHIQRAESYLGAVLGHFVVPVFHFYRGLICVALADLEHPTLTDNGETIRHYVQESKQFLERCAVGTTTNFCHKFQLVAAEEKRLLGADLEMFELYHGAIANAQANGFIQEEALANELFAKFYLNWGRNKEAAVYMQEAYYCYARWGAKAKTARLESNYPDLLAPILQKQRVELNTIDSLKVLTQTLSDSQQAQVSHSVDVSEVLDFASVLQAAQKLTSTINLELLLRSITEIILLNSGAKKMALLTPHGAQWHIEAIATQIDPENINIQTQSQPLTATSPVPMGLVQYVKNTQETIVIHESQNELLDLAADYLLNHHLQSVLCLPLLNQGDLVAIAYLEHPTTKGIFTKSRQMIVEFLCAQAAVALQNAQLYQQAQRSQTKAEQALAELQQAQLQLVQSEKMSVLGNLVAGVAHEINNPVGFLQGNIKPAQDYVQDLFGLLDLYQETVPNPDEAVVEEVETIDLAFIREDLPKLLNSMNLGVERIRNISNSLRTFSRKDQEYKTAFNLHDGLDSTLLILKHRTKANDQRPPVKVVKEYGQLPEVQCFPGQLNQVFMNILANAIDAFDEANGDKTFVEIEAAPNVITIQTACLDTHVNIQIRDNGCGMAPTTAARIFEQGFTTKEVGKGTGLGMAIAHQIITEKHGGQITCRSKLNQGTTFMISLPITV